MALKPHGFIPVVHAATKDRPDEIDTLISAEAVAAALAELGFVTEVVAVDLDLNHFHALKRRDPLLVFNLVDAVRGDGRLAPVIPSLLDAVGLPYTGAHSDAWLETLSKVATKLKLEQAGLPTPGFSVDGAGLDPEARFIVKAVWEHGSLGLDQSSVVKGADVARVIADRGARFGTEHFAERYIEGREFNLALLEERGRARVLPMAEILFENWDEGTPRIVGYDAKWTSDSEAYIGTPRRFGLEEAEPALAAQLEKLAKSCWDLFNLAGYARVDFRVDAKGQAVRSSRLTSIPASTPMRALPPLRQPPASPTAISSAELSMPRREPCKPSPDMLSHVACCASAKSPTPRPRRTAPRSRRRRRSCASSSRRCPTTTSPSFPSSFPTP